MKLLKKILLGLVVLLAIPFVVALFVKKDYAVTREIEISRPINEVFGYLKMLKNQDNFSVWSQMDPAMKKEFRGEDGTIGAVSTWDSEKADVGKGEQEIKAITEGERIDFELRFLKPFEATEKAYFTTTPVDVAVTKVKWGFDGHMKYPMNLMLVFMDMEKMIGKDFEAGLIKLKTILEGQADLSSSPKN